VPLQVVTGDAVVRGEGASALKSVPLASVSLQPPELRLAAVVLERAAAAAAPS
jgi:hypothetical protein